MTAEMPDNSPLFQPLQHRSLCAVGRAFPAQPNMLVADHLTHFPKDTSEGSHINTSPMLSRSIPSISYFKHESQSREQRRRGRFGAQRRVHSEAKVRRHSSEYRLQAV